MTQPCDVFKLGTIPYQQAWDMQDRLAGEIAAGQRPATMLLLEHPHTYTFGRRGQIKNLLWDEAELARRGVAVHWVDRGGDVTYHGPGQLVGYPLIPLGTDGLVAKQDSTHLPQADYVGYVRKIERTLITALARLGVVSRQVSGMTGVWVQPQSVTRLPGAPTHSRSAKPAAKIAAIGVKVDARGVTRHGFALNVDPDMTYWEGIIACGLVGYPVTRLADLREPCPSMGQVEQAIINAFGDVFNFHMSISATSLPDEFHLDKVKPA
jgi:lipoyl(octanoyl) transferase